MNEPATTCSQVATHLAVVADLLPRYDGLFALLTPAEQTRSARYLHSSTREEFVIGRACLRVLLADHLQTDPRELVLTEGLHGKLQTSGVQFNLSHSHGLLAIAIADVPVGIDVEWADRAVEVLELASAVFLPGQIAELARTLEPSERRRLFFAMWTAQEAQAKCIGVGLAGLEQMRSQQATLHVQSLPVPDGYYAAVCTEGWAQFVSPVYVTEKTIEILSIRR